MPVNISFRRNNGIVSARITARTRMCSINVWSNKNDTGMKKGQAREVSSSPIPAFPLMLHHKISVEIQECVKMMFLLLLYFCY